MLVEWYLEQKCCYFSTGPGIAHEFGDAFSDDFNFCIRFRFLAKNVSIFMPKVVRCEAGTFCGNDFEKFRPVVCDVMQVLRHQISPEYR